MASNIPLTCGAAGLAHRALRAWRIPALSLLLLGAVVGCGSSATGPGDGEALPQVGLCSSEEQPAADSTNADLLPCLDRVAGPAPLAVHATPRAPGSAKVAWAQAGDTLSQRATRVFVQPGTYTVTLVVRYPSGRQGRGTAQITVLPPETHLSGAALCRVGSNMQIAVESPLPYPLTWQTERGSVAAGPTSAVYTAPASPFTEHVQAVYNVEGALFPMSLEVQVYRQFVILKADDAGRQSARWQRYLDQLCALGIPNSAGLVGVSLQGAPSAWAEYLVRLQGTGLVEYFHHGWDHATGDSLGGAVTGTTQYEFQGTTYAHQKSHLDRTLSLTDSLGFVVTTFGAPFNRVDANTVLALNDTPRLRTVLYQPAGTRQLLLRRTASVEVETGQPSLSYFESQYTAYAGQDCLVLQVHPNAFSDEAFAEMWRILSFLFQHEDTFVTPEAYRLLRSGQPAPAIAVRHTHASTG